MSIKRRLQALEGRLLDWQPTDSTAGSLVRLRALVEQHAQRSGEIRQPRPGEVEALTTALKQRAQDLINARGSK